MSLAYEYTTHKTALGFLQQVVMGVVPFIDYYASRCSKYVRRREHLPRQETEAL
jgi:hypothetical protein